MTIDWSAFTPYSSLAGGAMIGLSAALLLLLNGRIAGISGIVGGALRPVRGDLDWRLCFLGGLVAAPLAYRLLFAPLPAIVVNTSTPLLLVAGFLVGFGTRHGSGCTSGHGVCGLSRRSLRSLIATLIFMAAGFAATYATLHGHG